MSPRARWCVGLVLLFVSMVLLSACGGTGKPTPEQIARICEENADKIERIRSIVERRGKSVLERIKKRARGKGVQFLIENCLRRDQEVPQIQPAPIDRTVASSLKDETEFLYTGDDPVQTGVDPADIEAKRVAVVRGRVLNQNGEPESGVSVQVLGHPEFGQTLTRADGRYDLAVNGGGKLTLRFSKSGFFATQRPLQAPWRDYVVMDDVVLTEMDANVTSIDFTEDQTIQVHQGSVESDTDGERQATMFFKPGTNAVIESTTGETESVSSLDVRVTEYTVGANGPEAMPAPLPPTSAYTYASELSTDQTLAENQDGDTVWVQVTFDQPVSYYVENFLGFPVGGAVPAGTYDRPTGEWKPKPDGRIIQIVGETNGVAQVDATGDGQADSGDSLAETIGLTSLEREQLAGTFDVGDSLWRVQTPHFTPWDLNWPRGEPEALETGTPPNLPTAEKEGGEKKDDQEEPCQNVEGKSVINVQNQSLNENIQVVGSPVALTYKSSCTEGYEAPYRLVIPVTGDTVPEDLKRVKASVSVAGRHITRTFPAEPNQTWDFQWDGRDAYGRLVQGQRRATVQIGFVYNQFYRRLPWNAGSNFMIQTIDGSVAFSPESQSRGERTLSQTYEKKLGTFQNKPLRLGTWRLDNHHVYDFVGQTLYKGDGTQRSARTKGTTIITRLAGGSGPFNGDSGPAENLGLFGNLRLASDAEGNIYVAEQFEDQVWKITPDGTAIRYAGTGEPGFSGDGGPATEAQLDGPRGLDIGPEGSLYIADQNNNRVRKVTSEGIIQTVAGNGTFNFGTEGDGGPATEAQVGFPTDVVASPDGGFYVGSGINDTVRRITPDGIIHTVSGKDVEGLALSPDGSVYILNDNDDDLYRLSPDGSEIKITGTDTSLGLDIRGVPVSRAFLDAPEGLHVDNEGQIYIADPFLDLLMWINSDNIYNPLGGICCSGGDPFEGEGGPATATRMSPEDVTTLPDGGVVVGSTGVPARVMLIEKAFANFSRNEELIPSEDGQRVFVFTPRGRHKRTVDARTGTVLFDFSYNDAGLLTAVTDRDSQTTTIERASDGTPEAIVSPFGQRTELSVNSAGELVSVTNPANEATQLTYADTGLLASLTDPKGNQTSFSYSDLGRLTRDEDPKGGALNYSRRAFDTGFVVTETTAMGRTREFEVNELLIDGENWNTVGRDGLLTGNGLFGDGGRARLRPDGTQKESELGPDPRFGMQAPQKKSLTLTTPGGLELNLTRASSSEVGEVGGSFGLASSMDTVTINGRIFTQTYDGSNQMITNTSPEGRTTTAQLNEQARIAEITQGDLLPASFDYNTDGQLTETSQGNRTSTFSYNADGFLTSLTDPTGRTTQFSYDNAGRVITQTLPDGRQIGFQYDDNGNLTALTPPGRNTHVFRYTSRDQTQEYDPPDLPSGSTITTWTYNLDEQLTQIERPDMTTVNFGYDDAGRLSSVAFPADQRSMTYSSPTGNLTGIQSTNGVNLSFAYDGSLPTEVQWNGADVNGSLSITYDADYRIIQQTINGSRNVSFSYDADGLLTGAGDLLLNRDTQNGLLTAASLGDVQTSWSHNDFGELASRSSDYAGSPLYAANLKRDTAGRIVSLSEDVLDQASRNRSFNYDEAGRLVGVDRGNGETVGYQYDSNGNRTGRTGAGVDQTDFSYDAQDRLLSYRQNGDTLVEFGYMANGELQSKTVGSDPATNYDYDAMGNLRSVTLKGDTSIEYIIDSQNRRVGKKVNGQFKQGFIYQDQLNPVAELDQNGDIESVFIYGAKGTVPSYMIKNGTKYRIISNHLGSVRMVVNTSNGDVVQRIKYDAFGRVIEDSNPGFQPFGFAGGLHDQQTGLVRFGARDYDPRVGRWTNKDPLLFDGGAANLYGYGLNDPVNLKDSDGKLAVTTILTAATIATGVISVATAGVELASIISQIESKQKGLRNLIERAGLIGERFSECPELLKSKLNKLRNRQQAIRDEINSLRRSSGLLALETGASLLSAKLLAPKLAPSTFNAVDSFVFEEALGFAPSPVFTGLEILGEK